MSAWLFEACALSALTSAGVLGLKAPDRNDDAAVTPLSARLGCFSTHAMMLPQEPGAVSSGVVGWATPGLRVVVESPVFGSTVTW
jgi:hypothetical protein